MDLHRFFKAELPLALIVSLMLIAPYAHGCLCPTSLGWRTTLRDLSRCYYTSSWTINAPGGVIKESVLNYTDARKRCQSLGGDLISASTQDEFGFLIDLILARWPSPLLDHWIGARRRYNSYGQWIWEDGSDFDEDWTRSTVIIKNISHDIALYADPDWHEAWQSTALHFVCEKDVCATAAPTTATTATSERSTTITPKPTTLDSTTTKSSSTPRTGTVLPSSTSKASGNPRNSEVAQTTTAQTQAGVGQSDTSLYTGVGIGVAATIGIGLFILAFVLIFTVVRRRNSPNTESTSEEAAPPVYINNSVAMTSSPFTTNKITDTAIYSDIDHQGESPPEQEHAYQALQA